MLSWPATVRIFLGSEPTDMRKGFDSLAHLVESSLALDPLSGHLFVFRSRRGDRIKILYWDIAGQSHRPLVIAGDGREFLCPAKARRPVCPCREHALPGPGCPGNLAKMAFQNSRPISAARPAKTVREVGSP